MFSTVCSIKRGGNSNHIQDAVENKLESSYGWILRICDFTTGKGCERNPWQLRTTLIIQITTDEKSKQLRLVKLKMYQTLKGNEKRVKELKRWNARNGRLPHGVLYNAYYIQKVIELLKEVFRSDCPSQGLTVWALRRGNNSKLKWNCE